MTNKITGYRELTKQEVELINTFKDLAASVGAIIKDLESFDTDVDKRWLAIAKTDLQKGFMSLVRSVAKPTTF